MFPFNETFPAHPSSRSVDKREGSEQTLYNLEAEQALLGAIFIDNEVYHRISSFLKDVHFGEPLHQAIYKAISQLMNKHRVVTPITIRPLVEMHGAFSPDRSAAHYLAELAGAAVGTSVAVDYAHIVFDLALLRSLRQIGAEIQSGVTTQTSPRDQITQAEQHIYQLGQNGHVERTVVPFAQALAETITMTQAAHKRGGGLAGASTSLKDLDDKLGGMHPSDLLILAGRPSMGKTALATNIAFNAALNKMQGHPAGVGVGFFSLEMSAEQLAGRILAEQTEINSEKLRRGMLTDLEFERLIVGAQNIEQAPLYIDDTPAIPMSTLATRARRLKRQHDIGLVVVDYLQLIRPSSGGRGSENRVQELSEITQGLKALAKELNVPVMALSQLSRAVETREDKRPQLSDLRESGSIEQDADVVMFVFREEYYLARTEPSPEKTMDYQIWEENMKRAKNVAEVIIGKQRHGPIGTVRLHFMSEYTRFGNLSERD